MVDEWGTRRHGLLRRAREECASAYDGRGFRCGFDGRVGGDAHGRRDRGFVARVDLSERGEECAKHESPARGVGDGTDGLCERVVVERTFWLDVEL